MGLKLQSVPARRGADWVRLGLAEFFRRPIAYISLFLGFMFVALLVSMLGALLPALGTMLLMMGVPLLTLAFMMATQHGLRGRPVQPTVYFEPWRGTKERKRALVTLGLLYAIATLLVVWVSTLVDGGGFDKLLETLSRGDATPEQVKALAEAPGVWTGAMMRATLTTLLSVPFWHAPALVHWGGQSAGQALFSSTLAVWRARGAFTVYGLVWAVVMLGFGVVLSVLLLVLEQSTLAGLLMMPAALVLSTAFYVSLYFSFADSFGEPDAT